MPATVDEELGNTTNKLINLQRAESIREERLDSKHSKSAIIDFGIVAAAVLAEEGPNEYLTKFVPEINNSKERLLESSRKED